MEIEEIWGKFMQCLYSDLDPKKSYPEVRPLLAHYTSLEGLEQILTSSELWLSNPLFMNDLEEVKFGIINGYETFINHEQLRKSLEKSKQSKGFFDALETEYDNFTQGEVIDLYVLCFSEHLETNMDGRLSMWRGYGNNGNGAAIVFDTGELTVPDTTPLVLSHVNYVTAEQRLEWLNKFVGSIADFFENTPIPDELIYGAVQQVFERLLIFSVYTKHVGFIEEAEWRIVYIKSRDPELLLQPMYGYYNGDRGIEPKLKLELRPIEGVIAADFELSNTIHSIILGPTSSSPLAQKSAERMLKNLGNEELIDKLTPSNIPYRAV